MSAGGPERETVPGSARVRAVPAILNAGAIAGAMDITAASIQAWLAGRTPVRMLQGIASGWLGKASFQAGGWSAALGFVSHFTIATTWAAVFWFASRRWPVLVRNAWVFGALYGLVVYACMYEVVIPLSAIHRHLPRTPQALLTGLLIHIVCVGWPIALTIRAHTPRRDTSTM